MNPESVCQIVRSVSNTVGCVGPQIYIEIPCSIRVIKCVYNCWSCYLLFSESHNVADSYVADSCSCLSRESRIDATPFLQKFFLHQILIAPNSDEGCGGGGDYEIAGGVGWRDPKGSIRASILNDVDPCAATCSARYLRDGAITAGTFYRWIVCCTKRLQDYVSIWMVKGAHRTWRRKQTLQCGQCALRSRSGIIRSGIIRSRIIRSRIGGRSRSSSPTSAAAAACGHKEQSPN